jgi:hypothetical protein
MSSVVIPWIVDCPRECDVIQRGPDNRANIDVRVFDTKMRSFQAEIEGIGSTDLADRDGTTLHGVLRNVPTGDHRLLVHGKDVTKVIDLVGVGDVHGAIGQSHTAGRSWTLFRSGDGRTMDPTNVNDPTLSNARDSGKLGGEHDPEGHALGSWFPLLADHLTALWGAPQRFLNYAVGASHTSMWQPRSQAFRRAVNAFENARARFVMFNIGATDAMEGASVQELKDRISATVRDLQRRGFIVLLARMPISLRDDWNEAMKIQHRAVLELWKEIPGLNPGADLSLLDPERHVNRVDGVHLNAAGYREAARLWAEAYRSVRMYS